MVKLEIFIPTTHLEPLREALQSAGAGAFGNYDSTLSYSPVKGCWRPLAGANPYDGEIGKLCEEDEYKVEVNCPNEILQKVVDTIKAVHPYEEPVINVIPIMATTYTKSELEEARTALTSTLHKCEKVQEGKKLGKSQQTLLDRRIRALRISLALIEREMDS